MFAIHTHVEFVYRRHTTRQQSYQKHQEQQQSAVRDRDRQIKTDYFKVIQQIFFSCPSHRHWENWSFSQCDDIITKLYSCTVPKIKQIIEWPALKMTFCWAMVRFWWDDLQNILRSRWRTRVIRVKSSVINKTWCTWNAKPPFVWRKPPAAVKRISISLWSKSVRNLLLQLDQSLQRWLDQDGTPIPLSPRANDSSTVTLILLYELSSYMTSEINTFNL